VAGPATSRLESFLPVSHHWQKNGAGNTDAHRLAGRERAREADRGKDKQTAIQLSRKDALIHRVSSVTAGALLNVMEMRSNSDDQRRRRVVTLLSSRLSIIAITYSIPWLLATNFYACTVWNSTQINSTLLILILQPEGWIKNIQLQKKTQSKHSYTIQ